jgi:hypothetical protein
MATALLLDGPNDPGLPAPERFEVSRQHKEEVDRLRRGIKAWCVTADDNFDAVAGDECNGTG